MGRRRRASSGEEAGEETLLDFDFALAAKPRMLVLQREPAFSTPELFSFAHDRRREELWGTLDQALSLFVVG